MPGNITLFNEFLKINSDSITEAVFVFRISIMDCALKTFQIYCMPSSPVSAQKDIHGIIYEILKTIEYLQTPVFGIAINGDLWRLTYSNAFVDKILSGLEPFCPSGFVLLFKILIWHFIFQINFTSRKVTDTKGSTVDYSVHLPNKTHA